jgi:hypothetical protein
MKYVSNAKQGDRLIFKHQNGTTEECEFLFKGLVPGCVVVRFFDKDGRPTSHDGLTLPIRQLSFK